MNSTWLEPGQKNWVLRLKFGVLLGWLWHCFTELKHNQCAKKKGDRELYSRIVNIGLITVF